MRGGIAAAILWLLGGTPGARGQERLILLQPGATHLANFPKQTTGLWVSTPGDRGRMFAASPADTGRAVISIPVHAFNFRDGRIAAARSLESGKWSSIHPLLIDQPGHPAGLSLPHATAGFVREAEPARLRFTVEAGVPARLEIVANRIGSQLDPVMRLLDEKGRPIGLSDDEYGSGRDSRLSLPAAPQKQSCVLEISDAAGKGGGDYFFVLRASVGSAAPASGWIRDESPSALPTEFEPNNSPASADRLGVPSVRQASFQWPDDRDWFEFEARAGQRLVIATQTRQFGSPCDAGISLFDGSGKRIAEAVGAGAEGASLTNRFDHAGVYRVEIREISKLGGPRMAYWISLEEARLGIELEAEDERAAFSDSGEAKLKITCKRFGYDGPVTLKCVDLPNGIKLADGTIPEKKGEVELKWKRTKETPAFLTRISGEIEVNGQKFEFPVSTMPALRKLYPLMMFPPPVMDGWIAVNPSN